MCFLSLSFVSLSPSLSLYFYLSFSLLHPLTTSSHLFFTSLHFSRPAQQLSSFPLFHNALQPVHDYGTAAAKQPGTNWTTFTSANDTVYTQTSNGSLQLTLESRTVVFRGLAPAAQCGHFACPIRFQGTGVVTLGADRMLQTAIVWWGGNPKSPQATSIVAFVSTGEKGGEEGRRRGEAGLRSCGSRQHSLIFCGSLFPYSLSFLSLFPTFHNHLHAFSLTFPHLHMHTCTRFLSHSLPLSHTHGHTHTYTYTYKLHLSSSLSLC